MITTLEQFLKENKEIKENILNDNFWKWFDGSKVVDDEGNPLIYYHYSEKEFNSFIKNKGYNSSLAGTEGVQRHGFFFASDKSFSKLYGKHEYNCYLKVKKPFAFKEHYYYKEVYPQYSELFDEFIEFVEDEGIDLEYDYLSKSLNISPDDSWQFLDDKIGELFVSFLKKYGYDGVIFTEYKRIENDRYKTETVVVFEPNQIKSIENDGTWNIDDNNIYS